MYIIKFNKRKECCFSQVSIQPVDSIKILHSHNDVVYLQYEKDIHFSDCIIYENITKYNKFWPILPKIKNKINQTVLHDKSLISKKLPYKHIIDHTYEKKKK